MKLVRCRSNEITNRAQVTLCFVVAAIRQTLLRCHPRERANDQAEP